MKAVRTFSFLVIFIALGLAFLYLNIQQEDKKEALRELVKSEVLLPNSVSDQINYLVFDRLGNPAVVMKRQEQIWNITSPVKTQADQMVAKGIVAALRYGKKEDSFESEEDGAAYGFKTPAVKLTVGMSRSSKKMVLVLGNKVPLKPLFYAKWEGATQIFLISEDLWKAFDRNLLSLRRRLVFNFEPEDVSGFKISYAGKEFNIVREGASWKFAKGSAHEKDPVEPVLANAYLELLRTVVAGEFLDDKDWKDDRVGIRMKQNFVNLYFRGAKPQILYLGYPSRELNGTYGRMDNVFDLVLIHSKVARRLQSNAESFMKSEKRVIE
ncbi:MAG: DUF4340 domain-containing protein [Candidatus Omnitrophica bacterium]|nr:DUF4340 domain-containing protein [Candidatus Omnitrophota bacterium]